MTDTQKSNRREEIQNYKRQKILDAASRLFQQNGLEGTTMRAIAKQAGYSTGAPYAYFQSKEEIYSELLFVSLKNLTTAVKAASQNANSPTEKVTSAFRAYAQFYLRHPEDLQLGLYLFSSGQVRKQGFSDETNRLLNGKLTALLGSMAHLVHQAADLEAETAQTETLDTISFITGTLILSETGRLSLFGASAEEMIDRHIQQMLKRF
ncbi:TetR/AcrR family transcriptional regulator [Sneathiella limimaris]|uniref:TetR/AcrR family transcriptional regulator n=1 Tax=Sneathiella limimaris TaxID=1964213 RepID=UPI00146A962C|nr:TetR/AcrR family transcriptional regulator [Sneathiella limimaris]